MFKLNIVGYLAVVFFCVIFFCFDINVYVEIGNISGN